MNRNLEEKFVILRKGPHADPVHGYNTVAQAVADGAVVLSYGAFIDNVASFLALGMFLYFIARVYSLFAKESIIKHTVKCAFCRKYIPEKVWSNTYYVLNSILFTLFVVYRLNDAHSAQAGLTEGRRGKRVHLEECDGFEGWLQYYCYICSTVSRYYSRYCTRFQETLAPTSSSAPITTHSERPCLNQFEEVHEEDKPNSNGQMYLQTKTER